MNSKRHCQIIQILLGAVLHLVGAACSLGMVGTDIYRYIIIKGENATLPKCASFTVRALQFIELSGWVIIDMLRFFTFIIFIAYTKRRLFCKNLRTFLNLSEETTGFSAKCKSLVKNWKWSGLLSVTTILLVSLAISVIAIDVMHMKSGDAKTCGTRNSIEKLITSVFNLIALISLAIMTIQASRIVCSSVHTWDTSKLEEKIKKLTRNENLDKITDDKLYDLYNNYIDKGEKIKCKCSNILKHWYVLIYVMYLLYIFVTAIHVMKNLHEEHEREYPDIIRSTLSSLTYFIIFYIPYFMGITLNKKHKKYYLKMVEVYMSVHIPVEIDNKKIAKKPAAKRDIERADSPGNEEGDENQHTITFLCGPGNNIKCIDQVSPHVDVAAESVSVNTRLLESPVRLDAVEQYRQTAQDEYRSYYLKAMEKNNMTKIDDFDLVPSIFNTNIRLEGNGYTIPIIIAIISVIFHFI